MKCITRQGKLLESAKDQEAVLAFLYKTALGRRILHVLIHPAVSRLGGAFMNSRISCLGISSFVKKNQIPMQEFQISDLKDYTSYNQFFCRKVRPECRPVNKVADCMISPCDSKLMVYSITADGQYTIKHTPYTLDALLRSEKTAKRFYGGQLFLFRLTVDDYHRYCYPDDGIQSAVRTIPGVFHTVNPIANDYYPIYKENTRAYSLLKTKEHGTLLLMEVGALMVGKIVNHSTDRALVRRGQEKGYFEFGGSTVIVCVQKGQCLVDADITENSQKGIETVVRYGEGIGTWVISYPDSNPDNNF